MNNRGLIFVVVAALMSLGAYFMLTAADDTMTSATPPAAVSQPKN